MCIAKGNIMSIMALQTTPALRLFQHPNPAAALGLAVSHLMTKPAFARLRFGAWSRVLTGQINRKHYYLAVGQSGEVVGFIGWAVTDEITAESWLGGWGDPSGAASGDCVIINAWSADTPAVNQLLLGAARRAAAGYRLVYFKRHYPDGRTRNSKMALRAFTHSSTPGQTQRQIA
jgi:hemolysin-activating ACP:hemolysin acyltransferase